jgi:erythromycin esterase
MKPPTYLLLACLLALLSGAVHGQARLNLGFEPDVNRPNPLLFWTHSKNPAVRVALDTTTAARQGRGSVRIELEPGEDVPSVYLGMSNLLLDSLRGNVTVRAYLRTAGFRGKAGLSAHASASQFEQLVSVDSVKIRPADSDWQLLEIRFPLSEKARSLGIGLLVEGTGRVWLDAVEVLVGSRRYRDAPLPGTEPFLLPPAAPNWDFERPLAAHLAAPRYTIDSVAPARGRRSLLLTPPPGHPTTSVYLGVLPIAASEQGKVLTINGLIRPAAGGAAPALYYALLSEHRNPAGTRAISAIHSRTAYQEVPLPLAAGAAWQPFRVQVPLPPLLNDDFQLAVSLGVRLAGAGPVGLDALTFEIDGKALATAPATAAPAPSAAEVAWLRPHLLSVPLAPPLADLAPLAALRPVFAQARVVGLGQVTTSSTDLAQLKFRLFRLLAEQQGFTYLVLDADMVAAAALDAYVQGGPGNAPALLAALGPAYGIPPLAALVQWLRSYNQRPGVARLHVAGLQPQQPLAALAALRPEPAFQTVAAQQLLQKTEQALAALGQAVRAGASAEELLPPATTATGLVQELAAYFDVRAKIGRTASPATLAWPRQQLRLLVQYATTYTLPGQQRRFYQTAALAENVYWLSQQPGAPKLAVWGHNDLVALTDDYDRPLGQWLRTTYGPAYFAVGCTFHQGTYRAGGAGLATAQASYPGTVEAWLHATGLPAALLPLRPLKLSDDNAWLFQSQLLRDIRQPAPAQDFHLHQPRLEFDALLFVDAIKE